MTGAPMPPRLTVVIVSYNARRDLERTLESLFDAPPTLPHQVVVVDNASTDGSLASVRSRWPMVLALEAGGNLGFSKANNIGIRATSSELVLLLNSDTVVPPGALDALVGVLDRHPEVAALGPRLVDGTGRPELSFGRMIGPWNELRQKTIGRLYERGNATVTRGVERRVRLDADVDWVSGACLLVRRADAETVGLLDERFFLYTEDVDFCASLRAIGRSVRFTGQVEITHLRGRSRASNPSAATAVYRRSHLAFYAKHHPGWYRLLRAYLRFKGALPDDAS
jgi:N-acetylglucosaminyl-diphospho-decaprenol L-rhamnosyltransferase